MTVTLEKADSQEFARYWVVYRNTNEDFSQSFAEQYQDIQEVPFCHWILADGQHVGGMIHVGQSVGDFFLIPPYEDAYSIFKAILPNEGQVHARNILGAHVPALQMLGFQIEESRCWMLRPTQTYEDIPFVFKRALPEAAHADQLAQLMLAAFEGGVGQYGQRKLKDHRQSVDSYLETIASDDKCHLASSVLFDGAVMIAACLAQTYKSLATIRFMVTHPEYQRRGTAKQLMQYSIHMMNEHFNYVGLAVTIGNPAHGLYHEMGFVTGATTYTLVR